jgi:CRISPR-associated protein (TIGR02710 family)
MSLEWLQDKLTDDEKRTLEACMAAFSQVPPDASQLRQQAAGVESLEKRYVVQNPAQQVDESLRGKVLVCTVGMRPLPVVLSILILRPSKVYLLHTNESRRSAESIRDDPHVQALGLHPSQEIILRTISLTDAPVNYDHLRRILEENAGQSVIVDVSGGVKVMGVSLASAAFWLRIPVVYQLGEEVAGTVRPFSARLQPLQNPFEFFGSTEIRSIQELFSSGDYDAALAISMRMRETVGDVVTLGKLAILADLIAVYRDWDAFMHSRYDDDEIRKLATRLRVVKGKMDRSRLAFMDGATVHANLEHLQELESSWQPRQRNQSDRHRLMDIYAAALRRGKAGKYDDAVARLYRSIEMCATICLVEGCAIGDVAKRPNFAYFEQAHGGMDKVRAAFTKIAHYELPDERLGLDAQMHLLAISKNKQFEMIASIYQGIKKSNLDESRNRSTLAHGTVPVSKDDYDAYRDKTRSILEKAFTEREDFSKMLARATHPDLTIEL